jgi:hypothetical protein
VSAPIRSLEVAAEVRRLLKYLKIKQFSLISGLRDVRFGTRNEEGKLECDLRAQFQTHSRIAARINREDAWRLVENT